ncbi:NB-ARC domain-containing protein [Haloactinospora alba]|uniref:NB-ARC domain-containing protein n=1 Tax=Haloactinospora alba TaxID=405555 RepID=A0A543NL30_9ACTN|nr:tetratricopeptide repeat protein [Haloactinospora alba]TQN32514.1 NB-ARC domain-containing protein [Haloactinospora alba]
MTPPEPRRRVIGSVSALVVAALCVAVSAWLEMSPEVLEDLPRSVVWLSSVAGTFGSALAGVAIDRGWRSGQRKATAAQPAYPHSDLPPLQGPNVGYSAERALLRRLFAAFPRSGWRRILSRPSWMVRGKNRYSALIIAITGPTGTGKTRLSLRIAHEVADRFPDGVRWRDMCGDKEHFAPAELELEGTHAEEEQDRPRSLRLWEWINGGRSRAPEQESIPDQGPRLGSSAPRTVRSLLNDLLATFDSTPRAPRRRLGEAWRALTAGKRILLVLDNVEDPEKVGELIPNSPKSAVVLTCRGDFEHHGMDYTRIPLSGFDVAEGAELLERHAPTRGSSAERSRERELRREIIEHCHGLPQTLGMCGRWLDRPSGPTTSELLEQLRETEQENPLLRPDEPAGFAESFIGVFQVCSARDRLLLWRMATNGLEELSDYTAAALLDVPRGQAQDSIRDLERLFLLEPLGHAEDGVDRYRMPQLVRGAVLAQPHEKLGLSEVEEEAWGREPTRRAMWRLLVTYTWLAEQAAETLGRSDQDFPQPRLDPLPSVSALELEAPEHPRAWLAREREMLLGCCFVAQVDNHIQIGWRLSRAVSAMCQVVRTHWEEWGQAVQTQCDLAAAGSDPHALGMAMLDNAELCGNQGRYDRSVQFAQRAEYIFEQLGSDPRWHARAWRVLGVSLYRRGDLDRAREILTQTERVLAQHDDQWWRARTRCDIAEVYSYLGRYTVAQDLLERAQEDFQDTGDPDQRDLARLLLADVLARRGRHLESWLTLRDLRDRFHEGGKQWYVARCLRAMGTLDTHELEAQYEQCDLVFNTRRDGLRYRLRLLAGRLAHRGGPDSGPLAGERTRDLHQRRATPEELTREVLGSYAEWAKSEFNHERAPWLLRFFALRREWSAGSRTAMLREAISSQQRMGDQWGVYRGYLTLGRILARDRKARRRKLQDSAAAFATAVAGFDELGDTWWAARSHRIAARELFQATMRLDSQDGSITASSRARDWLRKARDHAERAYAAYQNMDNHVGQIRSEILLARILWVWGAPEDTVVAYLRSAIDRTDNTGEAELREEALDLNEELFHKHPGNVARRWPIN